MEGAKKKKAAVKKLSSKQKAEDDVSERLARQKGKKKGRYANERYCLKCKAKQCFGTKKNYKEATRRNASRFKKARGNEKPKKVLLQLMP